MPELLTAVIGGSGIGGDPAFAGFRYADMETPYGRATVGRGTLAGAATLFLARHGREHDLAPHRVNYRANLHALRALGADRIVATAAVGAIAPEIHPGDLVIVEDFIDFTRSRRQTFFDEGRVVHADMSQPYDPDLSGIIARAAAAVTGRPPARAVYAATEGPRFETRAEIRMLKLLGAGVVGMTGAPEAALAAELEMPYAVIAVATNYACGIGDFPQGAAAHTAFMQVMEASAPRLIRVLTETVRSIAKGT